MVEPSESATVRARQPKAAQLRRLNFTETVSASLWYVPGLFVLGAFTASKITVAIDHRLGATEARSWLLHADTGAAVSLTSTVAAAMLTFLGVVFSSTLIAVQLAGGQYSPRVVRVFVRSRLTHLTLAIFLATFVFALNALVEIRTAGNRFVPEVTVAIVYLLVFATLLAFITFLHGFVRLLRVQYLLLILTTSGRDALDDSYPPATAYVEAQRANVAGLEPVTVRNRGRVGVLQSVDWCRLAELARTRNAEIVLTVEVGEYIGASTALAQTRCTEAPITDEDITSAFLLGGERTTVQDPSFVFRQLVDVAIRALSPAVNDPTTAVQALDRITDLLAGIATRPDPTGWLIDTERTARVMVPTPDFTRLALLGYVEIIRYGADSPQVVRRLLACFNTLDAIVAADHREVVAELRTMLNEASRLGLPEPFNAVARVADRHGFG